MVATKPDIWVDAEVYVTENPAAEVSLTGEFDEEWFLVGLLDGSAGFANTRAFEDVAANAWGKGQVAKGRRNFTSTGGFTALERNEITEYLMWPGSTPNVKVVPKPAYVKLAYSTVNQDGDQVILITRIPAEVFAPEVGRTEEVAGTAFEVTHLVDSKGGLFDEITVKDGEGAVRTIAPVSITGLTEEQEPLDLGEEKVTPTP